MTREAGSWRWWVCGVLLLATFLNYMDRQALAVTLPELKRDFHLGERRVGMVEMCFGLAFAFGSLFFGFATDRLGPRRLYPIVLTGWSLAGIATGFANHSEITDHLQVPDDAAGAGLFRWLLLWRTALGFFEAGHWPCALITAQRILAARDRPLGNAILQSGATFASVLIPFYATWVERQGWGWSAVFWSIGAVGLLWVPLWLLLIRGADIDRKQADEADDAVPVRFNRNSVKQLLILGIIVTCLTISWQFLRVWLPLLLDFHGYDREARSNVISSYFLAAEAGCLLAGGAVKVLVRRGQEVHRARVTAFAVFTALTGVATVVPFLGSGQAMVAGLLIAGAGILGLHPLYYALTQELPRKTYGTFAGALAFAGWAISSVFQMLIGARIEETKSYDVGLAIAGLAPAAGLVALLLLWPTAGSPSGRSRLLEPRSKSPDPA
jgi:ACS family hexuronate transporter-like MFS transporter